MTRATINRLLVVAGLLAFAILFRTLPGLRMPRVRTRSARVVGLMPSRSAAPPEPETRQFACFRAAIVLFFWNSRISCSVRNPASADESSAVSVPFVAASGRDASSRSTLPRDRITARSMTFLSSRTLPGQS